MANPLVAEVQDSTTAISGVPILESISETSKAIESGDWAAGVMGAAGTALDALGMAMDPFGSILAAGVGWLIEHVGPLSDALDALTGNADEIKSHSETWKNVGTELSSISADLAKMIEEDTASWTGPAGDAYRTRGADTATLIAGAQTAAEGASSGIGTAGEVVGAVRSLVRDIIAELVGHMISWALQVLFTLGIGMAWVVPQVISAVAKTAMKIADITKKLVQALSKLSPLLKKLGDSFGDAAKKLKDIKGGKKPDANTAKGDNNGGTSASSAGPTPNSPPGQSNGHGGGGNNGSSSNNDGPTPNTSSSSSSNNSSSNGNSSTNSSSANNNTRPDAVGKDNRECVTDPVDVMTGEVVTTEVDLTLHGFTLERTHISSYRAGRGFGANWASTVDQRLELGDGVIRFFTADGMALVYPTPNGTALPIDGPRWPLTADGPGYRIDDPLGEQSWFFAPVPGARPAVRPLVAIERDHLDRIEIEHDGLGTPVLLRHNAGSTIRLSTEQQRVTGIEVLDETGQSVQVAQFGYDDRSRLATVVNSSGTPLKYEYDPQGRLTGWQDRTGTWYRYTYNADGRCVATTGPDGFYSGTLSYDRDQLITTYTDSLGASTEYHFTAARQLSRRVGPSGDVVAYEWDRYDHLLSRTDPLGATTSFTYDERGALATVTRPDGSVLDVTQDAGGLTIGIEENGTRITRFYPAEEAPDPFEDTLGISAPMSYEQLAATNPANADDSGRPQDRDVFGRVKAELNKSQQPVVLGWTVEGQERLRVQPSGVRQTRRHDAEGREIEHVNGAGVTTRTEYGAFGLVTATIDGTGARTSYTYDTELRLASMTNPLGLTWTYRYDPAGRLAGETDYDGRTLAFTYDRAGRLTESSNGDGQRTAYRYDALGNVVERQSPTGTTRYTYDALGRLTSAVLGDAELTITHDAIGAVTAESVNGRTVTRVRDADGALRRRTPSGVDSEWRFDSAGAPVSLVIAGHTIRFEHDSGGREITRIVDGRVTISQSFDADENLVAQAVQAEAAPPRQRRYTYRADGLLSGIDDDVAGSTRYALDAAGRVTGVQAPRGWETYRYDAAGNVVEEAFGVRQYSRNTLVSAGAATFEYDRQGRMTTRREGDRVWRYVWDGHDRLIALATPHGEQWLYRYDPLGRRIGKQRMATSPAGAPVVAETYEFTWTGALLAEQVHVDARGTRTVTTWEYRPGDDHPVAQVEQTSDVDSRFLAIVSDLLGRPVELLDAAGGLAWRENARLWGHEDGPAATPLRFPGQYADAESGLHYNVFRFYDPVLGRYLSQDPLGLGPAPNPVAYVDNPLVAADPLGLVCKPKSGTPDRPGAGGDASNVPGTRSPDTNRTTAGQARNNWKKKIREIRTSLVGSGSRPGKMDQAPSNNPGGGGPHESFNVSSLSTNPNQPNVDLLVHRPNGYINGFTRPDPANPNQTQAWTYPGNNAMSAAPPGAQQNILQGNNVNPNYSSSGGVGKLNVGQQSMNDALHTLGTSNNPQQLSHAIHTMSVNVMEPARMNGVANQVQNTFSGPGWQNASSPLPSAQQSQINNWGNSSQDWGGVHKPDSSHLNMHLGNNPDKPGPNSNPLNRR